MMRVNGGMSPYTFPRDQIDAITAIPAQVCPVGNGDIGRVLAVADRWEELAEARRHVQLGRSESAKNNPKLTSGALRFMELDVNATVAAEYGDGGWTRVASCIEQDVSADDARTWTPLYGEPIKALQTAGWTPEALKDSRNQYHVVEWAKMGVGPRTAAEYEQVGITADTAKPFVVAGVGPDTAGKWQPMIGDGRYDIQKWLNSDVDVDTVNRLHEQGMQMSDSNPEDVARYTDSFLEWKNAAGYAFRPVGTQTLNKFRGTGWEPSDITPMGSERHRMFDGRVHHRSEGKRHGRTQNERAAGQRMQSSRCVDLREVRDRPVEVERDDRQGVRHHVASPTGSATLPRISHGGICRVTDATSRFDGFQQFLVAFVVIPERCVTGVGRLPFSADCRYLSATVPTCPMDRSSFPDRSTVPER
jgi:hypothetical protein